MAAYSGGCQGHGTPFTYCICTCHIVSGADCDESSCLANGRSRGDGIAYFTSDDTDAPVVAMASDVFVSSVRHPNRSKRKPDRTSRRIRRAERQGRL